MIIGFPPQRNPQKHPQKHCEKNNYVILSSKKKITPENVEISRVFWLITQLLIQSGVYLNYAYWYGITPAGATTSEIAAGIEVG